MNTSPHEEIQPADPRARRRALVIVLIMAIVGLAAVAALDGFLQGLEELAKENPEGATQQLVGVLKILAGGLALFLLGASGWLSNLSRRLTRRRYRKGEIIFHKDDFGSTFHIITTGKVKLCIPEEDRDDMFLAYLEPSDFFGEMALLDESPRSATAIAIELTETLALERKDFLDFLKCHPDMAISMLNVLAKRLRDLNSRLQNIILLKPQTRLARTLLKLIQSHGKKTTEGWEISIPLTLTGLTETIGANTATIRRLLRELQTAGIISVSDQHYVIHSLEELQKK